MDILRHTTVAALVLASVAAAQSTGAEPERIQDPKRPATTRQANQTTDYVALGDLVGANVRLAANPAERQRAAEEGEEPDRQTGEIEDLIVECTSGDAPWAVVAVDEILGIGGRKVAIPASALRWNPTEEVFELDASEERLKKLPAFQLDKAREGDAGRLVKDLEGQWTASGAKNAADASGKDRGIAEEATGRRERTEEEIEEVEEAAEEEVAEIREREQDPDKSGVQVIQAREHFICASQIDDYPVYAQTEKFGSIENVLIDRAKNRIELLVVSHGGTLGMGDTELLMPYGAFKLAKKNGEEDDLLYLVDKPAQELAKSGVKYEKPEQGVVDPAAAQRAKEMFGEDLGATPPGGRRDPAERRR